jgi:hypothetical protein
MSVWTAIDRGTVYHCLVPTLIEGSTTSPNMSRGTGLSSESFERSGNSLVPA